MGEQAVDAGNSNIIQMLDAVAHEFSGDYRFFGYWNVAGTRGNDGDDSLAVTLAIAVESDGSGFGAVNGFGDLERYCLELFFSRACRQDVAFVVSQFCENFRDLRGRFALTEYHLGHAGA